MGVDERRVRAAVRARCGSEERPRDRRDREGNRWAELDPRRPCLRERTRLSQRPVPARPSQSSPQPSPAHAGEGVARRETEAAEQTGCARAEPACSPKRRSRFGSGGAEGAALTKPATDPLKRRAWGGRRAPACAPSFARDAVARSAPVTAAIAKATDGRSSILVDPAFESAPASRSGPFRQYLRSPSLNPLPLPRERESLVARRSRRADRAREGGALALR